MDTMEKLTEFEHSLDTNSPVEAFYNLAVSYAAGSDGVVDYQHAHKWFNIAASMGHDEAAEQRRDIAEYMSKDEIRSAQKDARAWLMASKKAAA